MTTPPLRLPRSMEADPRAPGLLERLSRETALLWPGSGRRIPVASMSAALAAALHQAHRAGHVVRGLETAERALAAEKRGLQLADRRSGVERGSRISRVLIVASDGAERFYRQVEALLRRHGPRLLALRLEVDEAALGALLFGPESRARLLLLEHKEAVAALLLAMLEPAPDDAP
jgi:hypothetical protein